MEYWIIGDVMRALSIDMKGGEEIYAEAGAMHRCGFSLPPGRRRYGRQDSGSPERRLRS